MNEPANRDLTKEEVSEIKRALGLHLADTSAQIDVDGVTNRNGEILVPIRPDRYPEDMYGFLAKLAAAEISLRDGGYKLRLTPGINQRMIVVASVPNRGEVVIESEDGREYQDLAGALNLTEQALNGTMIEGYAFDSATEREQVLKEAKDEHPGADFSRVA